MSTPGRSSIQPIGLRDLLSTRIRPAPANNREVKPVDPSNPERGGMAVGGFEMNMAVVRSARRSTRATRNHARRLVRGAARLWATAGLAEDPVTALLTKGVDSAVRF